jgi:hypothetical protein
MTRAFDVPPVTPAKAADPTASEHQPASCSAAGAEAGTPTAAEVADWGAAVDEEDGVSSKGDEEKCGIEDLSKSMKLGGAEGDFFQSVAAVTRADRQLLRTHGEAVDESEVGGALARGGYEGMALTQVARHLSSFSHASPRQPHAPLFLPARRPPPPVQHVALRLHARKHSSTRPSLAHRPPAGLSQGLLAVEKQLLEDRDSDAPCSLDEYAAALEKVLHHKMRLCIRVQAKLDALKQALADEEAHSARVKKLPVY